MVSQNYARDAHEGSRQGHNWRLFRLAWITATEFWAARRAEQLLMAKSDSELKDVGVRRHDIPRVVREGRLSDEDPVPREPVACDADRGRTGQPRGLQPQLRSLKAAN
jgi:uncharacterized protein YjiS (DUF1127 family)